MEEIKVGEYIRTPYNQIEKVIRIDEERTDYVGVETDLSYYNLDWLKERKVKHSKNIIDIIEVGDYVNGYKVIDVLENLETGELHLEMPMDYTNKELGDCTIYNKDIKDVVTKEQFNQMKYIVGDEREIHYNAFETIEEQLKEQGYSCKDIKLYEKAKDSILYLWFHSFLTDKEHDKAIDKLHKQIIKNIKKVEG